MLRFLLVFLVLGTAALSQFADAVGAETVPRRAASCPVQCVRQSSSFPPVVRATATAAAAAAAEVEETFQFLVMYNEDQVTDPQTAAETWIQQANLGSEVNVTVSNTVADGSTVKYNVTVQLQFALLEVFDFYNDTTDEEQLVYEYSDYYYNNTGDDPIDFEAFEFALTLKYHSISDINTTETSPLPLDTIQTFLQNYPPIQDLINDPRIQLVEQDSPDRIEASDDQPQVQTNPPSWGLDRIDQSTLPLDNSFSYNQTGQNVIMFVIDSGLLTTHTEFQSGQGGPQRAICGFDATPTRQTRPCDDSITGHGTHVAGTIGGLTYGVAKDITLIGVKVLNGRNGSMQWLISGIQYVIRERIRLLRQAKATNTRARPFVINLSLGGPVVCPIIEAIEDATKLGIVAITAAGNDNRDACLNAPGCVSTVINVGGSNRNDARHVQNQASGSHFGPCVDLFAPGRDILSAHVGSNTDSRTVTGTSMAAPHVAGVAALYLERDSTMTVLDVKEAIIGDSLPNRLTNIGTGSPNRLLNKEKLAFGTLPDQKGDPRVTQTSSTYRMTGTLGLHMTVGTLLATMMMVA